MSINQTYEVCTSENYPFDSETDTSEFLSDYWLSDIELDSSIEYLGKMGFKKEIIKDCFKNALNKKENALQLLVDYPISHTSSIKQDNNIYNNNNNENNSNSNEIKNNSLKNTKLNVNAPEYVPW